MLISDTVLLAAMKCLTKSTHRKEGLFGSQFKEQPVAAGKAWRRECQVASHIASAVKRQKELMLVPCASSFYSLWDLRPRSQAVHTRVSLCSEINSSIALTDLLRVLFPWRF